MRRLSLVLILSLLAIPALAEERGIDPIDCTGNTCNPGPDVTIFSLSGIDRFTDTDGTIGFSIGTDSCNVGDTPLNWCDNTGGCSGGGASLTDAQHPVIASNMYRVKDGRLEQLGKSWLKHGFLSTNTFDSGCGLTGNPENPPNCTNPPMGGNQLGVGCTDYYGPFLNGSRPMGQRAEVNATTGVFPFPFTVGGTTSGSDMQVKVQTTDLEPAMNPGAVYFMEGQYVVDDDGQYVYRGNSNAFNNASYRKVNVTGSGGSLNASFTGSTMREQSALYAWQAEDPTVEIVNADFSRGPVPERFEVARRISSNGSGGYTTVIVIRNMNSDTAAQSLTVNFPARGASAGISATGMRDVDDHSGGMMYSTTDWPADTTDPLAVSWATETFAANPTANSLRWATAYTFWFDSSAYPADATYEIGLFKPGTPSSVVIPFGASPAIFIDGFNDGTTGSWSDTTP